QMRRTGRPRISPSALRWVGFKPSGGSKMYTSSAQLLSRREFTARGGAWGLAVATTGAALATRSLAAAAAAPTTGRTVQFPNGTIVSALGQGAWHLGQGRHPPAVEEEAVRAGIALGMTLLDTSGNYGNGRSEEFIARVIAAQRERIFLVSKV